VFLAREPYWQGRFEKRGIPIIGDDIKSQVGATIVHRVLTRLFEDRGVKLERTYQLNFGGNTDFLTCSSASAWFRRRSRRRTASSRR
jgi:myo-inositol-1-phosphate synthase